MRDAGRWWIAGAVLLVVSGAACTGKQDSQELAALDSAYNSGVLTKSEYDAKRAAILTQSTALKALDKALQSGVIGKDEYLARKARLQANANALAALEKVRGAGILTKDEYLAKKSALLASSAPADPGAGAPAAEPAATPVREPAPPQRTNVAQADPASGPAPAGNVQPPPSQPQPVSNDARAAAPPPSSGDAHTYRMKMIKVLDQYGFEKPMPTLSMLIPTDWQSEGATTWKIKDKCNGVQTTLRATGPDGRAYEIFPDFSWVWADDPKYLQQSARQTAQFGAKPCDVMPPMSAQEYLHRNLARVRPNAQLVGIEPAPKLTEILQRQAREAEQAGIPYGIKRQVRPDAIRARLRYSVDGRQVEEFLFVTTVTTGTLSPGLNLQTNQRTQTYSYNCVARMEADRATQGQLDSSLNFFSLMSSTARFNPEWQARIAGQALAMQKIQAKGISDRSKIVAKSAEDTAAIRKQMYENQQKGQDRTNLQFSQNQRGVETYRNPDTGETVDLNNNYGHAWVNNSGVYLLSDQPTLDPTVANLDNWKPLEIVKK